MRGLLLSFFWVMLCAGLLSARTTADTKPFAPAAAVTILEFGSQCTPCKIMKALLTKTEKDYQGRVTVKYYDVTRKAEMQTARKYQVLSVPAQVFLNARGQEYERHAGILSARQIVRILEKGGITNGNTDESF